MDDFLTAVVTEEIAAVPERLAPRMNLTYIPQLGYFVMIPIPESSIFVQPDGYEFIFQTDEHYYYKNARTEDLDVCGDFFF